MKAGFVLLVSVISLGVAAAGDVTVRVTMSDELAGEAQSTFTSDTEKIYAMFKTIGAKAGDKIRAALIAENVGDAAPPNTKVLETNIDMDGDTDDGDFNFSKPTAGWPIGKYRVDVYLNDQLLATAKFTVKAAAAKKKSTSEKEEDSGD
jgi:outer membrane usher protein FimD/PapC